jgi:hypothetical protein
MLKAIRLGLIKQINPYPASARDSKNEYLYKLLNSKVIKTNNLNNFL